MIVNASPPTPCSASGHAQVVSVVEPAGTAALKCQDLSVAVTSGDRANICREFRPIRVAVAGATSTMRRENDVPAAIS